MPATATRLLTTAPATRSIGQTRAQPTNDEQLPQLLAELYQRQLQETPGDPYLAVHADPQVVRTQVNVFRWYRPYLPQAGRLLDWGCRHAPDACLVRAAHSPDLELHGCDLDTVDRFATFHRFGQVQFTQLRHVTELPYSSDTFDAIIGSGTLEHVAMDYESLKELYRVLKPGGRLIITYLPNILSYEEWWRRNIWQAGSHLRLYSRRELHTLLLRTGFKPLTIGYQNRYDLLRATNPPGRLLRTAIRTSQLHRITSTLCAVAEKVTALM